MTKDEALKRALENLLVVTRHLDVCPGTVAEAKEVLAQPEERNFCSRCGKRLGPEPSIHTCTPPARGTMAHYAPRTFDDYGNKIK